MEIKSFTEKCSSFRETLVISSGTVVSQIGKEPKGFYTRVNLLVYYQLICLYYAVAAILYFCTKVVLL